MYVRSQRGLSGGGATATNVGAQLAPVAGSTIATLAPSLSAAGPIGMVIGGVLTLVSAIFGHHSAAVAKEAQTLDQATPAFYQNMQTIFSAVNAGSITVAQASSYIDQAVAIYYQTVGSIMKKKGPCNIDSSTCRWNNSPAMNPCNGLCQIGCQFVEAAACAGKAALNNPGTAYTTAGMGPTEGSHQWGGIQSLTLQYNAPVSATSITSAVDSAAASTGLPAWMLYAIGGFVGAKALGVL